MRGLLAGLIACAGAMCPWGTGASARADDGVVIQSMRVEGTIPQADDWLIKPFALPPPGALGAYINGQFSGGEFFVVVTKDKMRGIVGMSFGGDKALKERAEQLVGQRVVVECKGEYKLHTGKVRVQQRQGWAEQDQVFVTLALTVTKIEPAK